MRKICLLLVCSTLVFFGTTLAFAQGINTALIAESKYFSVYCDRHIDVYELLLKLNFQYLLFQENLSKSTDDLKGILVKSLDSLYLSTSDILDIHIYSYHGQLMIFPDRAALGTFLKQSFGLELGERSYYIHESNTIYISFADLTVGVLGHEMAHAIISHYFVVPPPAKVQEILCGYVEYSLRKDIPILP